MTAYRPNRALPAHITQPNFNGYQVRIVRSAYEHSRTFSWTTYGGETKALAAAVAWRDNLLKQLPPAENDKGAFRRSPLRHKTSWGRVGITRYLRIDRRKMGQPRYLTFGVNWVDHDGLRKTKSFQVGKIEDISWQDEVHAANTAEAFRMEFEFCCESHKTFNPEKYDGWRNRKTYPFVAPTTGQQPLPSAMMNRILSEQERKACRKQMAAGGVTGAEAALHLFIHHIELDQAKEACIAFGICQVCDPAQPTFMQRLAHKDAWDSLSDKQRQQCRDRIAEYRAQRIKLRQKNLHGALGL